MQRGAVQGEASATIQRGAAQGVACVETGAFQSTATIQRGAASATVDAVGVQQGTNTNFQGTLTNHSSFDSDPIQIVVLMALKWI